MAIPQTQHHMGRILCGFFLAALFMAGPAAADDRKAAERIAAMSVISLNGTWEITPEGFNTTTIKVPGFYITHPVTGRFVISGDGPDNIWRIFEETRHAIYRRTFNIGADMAGQRIYLRFESVNFGCIVSVNGSPILTHYGGFLPFEVDITDHVTVPSSNNTLTVEIIGNNNLLFFQGLEEYPLWPIGFYGHRMNNGITGDVSLLSRSSLYIEDMYIKTSIDNMILTATVTVHNAGESITSGSCRLSIIDPVRIIGTQSFLLQPDSLTRLTFTYSWPDVQPWSPSNPRLYEIKASLLRNGIEINSKTTRFGFRQFKQQGTDFYLNGRRITLLGDNIVLHGEKRYWQYLIPDQTNWEQVVDSLLSLNCNVIRLHQEPPAPWMLDICDEKGMLVIAESAIYAMTADRQEQFIINARTWQNNWVKRDRNHPSIVIWSASNEMYFPSRHFTAEQIYRFGTAVTETDDTRPVFFEGDFDIEGLANIGSYHYIYGFPNGGIPLEGLYDINTYRYEDIPSSHGEFEWSRGLIPESERIRYQCLKSRAMRIGRWADIRPYRLDWAWHPNPEFFSADYSGWHPTENEIEFLKNSFNPVAVFDSAYYEFDAFPSVPRVNESEEIFRHLYIFNNENVDAPITVSWDVVLDGRVLKTDTLIVSFPPGGMAETDITFKAPIVPEDKRFYLRLNTFKNGQPRFSEDYPFTSLENGVWEPVAPKKPQALEIAFSSGTARLTWNTVTADTNGQPASIESYRIFRSSDIGFNPADTDSFTVTDTTFSDIPGPAELCNFYRVTAIDSDGRQSEASEIAGYITYQLRVTAGTDFNAIAVPFNGAATSAAALRSSVALCTSVASWSAPYQGFQQYVPQIAGSNFALDPGGPVMVNMTGETSWTISGLVTEFTYSLSYQSGTTNIHFITLPFSKHALTKASQLLADIPNCESVSYWNAVTQNYVQHIPGFAFTDFTLVPGHPYFIDVSASATWPEEGTAKPLPFAPLQPAGTALPGPPHLAVVPFGPLFQHHETITAVAWLGNDTTSVLEWRLDRTAPEDTILYIQCAGFNNAWHPSDTIRVTFRDEHGNTAGYAGGPLSSKSYDIFPPVLSSPASSGNTEGTFILAQNYPNPFNAGTSIEYFVTRKSRVTVTIYNLNGRRIRTLSDREQDPGGYTLFWDGKDAEGNDTSSGTYLCRISSENEHRTIRMINIK
ncbi:T9SS type A sorting domain-containing protein [bacterium]|nr:T9SS type A sorting domain-containing protein [bacterium]